MPSIKVLNIALVLLCIFITAFVCTFLAITSSEKALDDTKESRDVSVGSCFAVGEESVTNRTEEYLNLLMDSTLSYMRQFTQQHRLVSQGIGQELMAAPWDDIKQWDFHHLPRYYNAFRLLRDDGNSAILLSLVNRLTIIYIESTATVDYAPDEYHHIYFNYNHGNDHPWGGLGMSIVAAADSRGYPIGVANPLTDVDWTFSCYPNCWPGIPTNGTQHDIPTNSTDWADPPNHSSVQVGTIIPAGKTYWAPPIPVGEFLTLSCSTAIYHNGTYSGQIASTVELRHFNKFLSEMEIGGPVAGHPSRGRVYITLRSTWYTAFVQGGELIAASHGNTVKKTRANDFYILKPHQSSDSIISSVANATSELEMNLTETAASGDLTVVRVETEYAPEGEDFYYRVGRLNDEYGLDWYVHLVIDREYILGTIDRRTAETRDGIKASEQKVEDDLKQARTILYVLIAAVTLSLTVLSAVFVRILLRPLSGLMEEMVWVSEMDLDKAGSVELSAMVEVREMQVAFRKMKQNLKDFKAYVPVALLNSSSELVVVEPPSGDVALVFTDIVKSTELWERSASGMNEAMEIHNEIMRKAAAGHSGYEVKTIGDSFMVAFDDPEHALRFCLRALVDMAEGNWPSELNLDSQGMKVRIGCHVGHTIPEENPLTGRRDYRGSAVNLASRAEGKALPGTVCVSSELMCSVDMAALGNPKVEDIGMQALKGIEGEQHMYLVVPTQLGDRVSNGLYRTQDTEMGVRYSDTHSKRSTSEGGSLAGVFSHHGATIRVGKKTGLTLVKGNATVAVCMMVGARKDGEMFDDCNAMVRAAVEAASQTDGVVGNVTGQTLTVVWNGSKPCKLHTTSAMRFAAQLEVRAATMRIGAATGPLLHGNVGTQKRRFNTAFGRPLEAAHAGAALANHCGTFAILVDVTPDMGAGASAAVAPFVRLVDVWEEKGSGVSMSLYELLCRKLTRQLEDAWGTFSESDPELEAYHAAYRGALSGEAAALERLRVMAALEGNEGVVKYAVDTLTGLLPDANRAVRATMSFGNLPQGVLP